MVPTQLPSPCGTEDSETGPSSPAAPSSIKTCEWETLLSQSVTQTRSTSSSTDGIFHLLFISCLDTFIESDSYPSVD